MVPANISPCSGPAARLNCAAGLKFWRGHQHGPQLGEDHKSDDAVHFTMFSTPGKCGALIDVLIAYSYSIDSTAFQEDHVIGRDISPSPDISLAKDWISDCINNHSKCASNLYPNLPTRVVDVGPSDNTQKPRLLPGEVVQAPYVTLSHCWSTTKSLVTNSGNLQEHLAAIPFRKLPPMFQDAILATRKLGYRYLWIDSLCIIQDSPEDWQQECALMADIYKNAAVTITAPAAKDSSTGFLGDRTSFYSASCTWKYRGRYDGIFREVALVQNSGVSEFLNALEHKPVIDSRAWILQEKLLSQRVLYFGSRQMYMECNECYRFEHSHVTLDNNHYNKDLIKHKNSRSAWPRS
jgi:hypothetical protein